MGVKLSSQQADALSKYVESLPDEKRGSFVTGFQKLPEDGQMGLVDELVSKASSIGVTNSVSKESSNISTINPLGMNPKSGFVGANPSDVLKGSGETLAGAFEGLTLGLPREALSRSGVIDIPRGNLAGQMAGFALGPGKVVGAAGKALIPSSKFIPSIIRGGVEGALGGFAFPREKTFDLQSRIDTGLAGVPFGMGMALIGETVSAYKKINEARSSIRNLQDQQLKMRDPRNPNIPKKIDDGIKVIKNRMKDAIDLEKNSFDSEVSRLKKSIKVEAESTAQKIKQPIIDSMKSFKDEWGKSFDEALDSAPEQGIDFKDLKRIEEDTINELSEMGIDPRGNVVRTIRSLMKKYSPKTTQIPEQVNEIDPYGLSSTKTVMREVEGNNTISNRDLIKIRRQVSSSLSPRAKSGQFNEEDIAGAIFNKKLSDVVGDNVGERMSKLNSAYKDFSDLSKFAYKTFKPRASEFEIKSASGVLKRYANGTADSGEVSAIKKLEELTGVRFSKNVSDLGKQLESLKKTSPEKIADIEARYSRAIREMEKRSNYLKDKKSSEAHDLRVKLRAYRNVLSDLSSWRKIGSLVGTAASIGGSYALLSKLGIEREAMKALDASH